MCSFYEGLSDQKNASEELHSTMDRIQLDVCGPFPLSDSGNKFILVIIDQFTKWVEAFPIPSEDSETTAKRLVFDFISRFGFPSEVHTDQGQNFQNNLFREVCRLLGIAQSRTTPYHPSSNGQVERFNRTLLQTIRCYMEELQDKDTGKRTFLFYWLCTEALLTPQPGSPRTFLC